jgi:ubiquinone/menaquinone biosynthesis C-methylase UbiE
MSTTKASDAAPSPLLVFETLNAYQRTAALRAAIALELFTAIGQGRSAVVELARRIGASEKGTRVLCDMLVVIGFLTKAGTQYSLTADSAVFLDKRSPAYIGTAADFLGRLAQEGGYFQDLAAAVRKGGTTVSQEGTMEPEHPIWVTFARSMAPMMAMPAELLAGLLGAADSAPTRVLDIAAGHGLFGIAFARQNPNATVTAVDWKPVLEVAQENAVKAGVQDRYRTVAGSAFDVSLDADYDVVLLTNFLHHFDPPTCERLLRRLHAALRPGGKAVALEFIPNEDRVSPPPDATFSLIMLATTANGDAYTFSELDQMFRNAGFARSELKELSPTPQRVVVATR